MFEWRRSEFSGMPTASSGVSVTRFRMICKGLCGIRNKVPGWASKWCRQIWSPGIVSRDKGSGLLRISGGNRRPLRNRLESFFCLSVGGGGW